MERANCKRLLAFTWQNGRELADATNTSTSVAYTYNQSGIRTSKTVNGVKTTYILDENDLLMGEITGENTIVYLYDENNSIYGFVYNGTPYFYLFNAQGDVMNIVDEAGTVVATYNYDAWGKVITATGDMAAINPIRYRGYYYDAETELYYLQSRYYDATVCRFLNADSVFDYNQAIIGYNLFTYVRNTPINADDPTGQVIRLYSESMDSAQKEYEKEFLLALLQYLTDYKLCLVNGKVRYVSTKSGSKPLETRLVDALIGTRYVCEISITRKAPTKENKTRFTPINRIVPSTRNAKITINLQEYYRLLPKVHGYIILAHELIHAYRYFTKNNIICDTKIPYWITGQNCWGKATAEEIFTVGLYANVPVSRDVRAYLICGYALWITENAIRKEHNLPLRTAY